MRKKEDCEPELPTETCYAKDAQFYWMSFEPKSPSRPVGQLWNIETDKNAINFTDEPDTIDAKHNGYIYYKPNTLCWSNLFTRHHREHFRPVRRASACLFR